MTVPSIFGLPLNIWLGLLLLILVPTQIVMGVLLIRGNGKILKYHKWNAALILLILSVHAFYGIGVWFFRFSY